MEELENINPELLKDSNITQENEVANKNTPSFGLRKKKEKPLEKFSFVFYQYTIRKGSNPVIIIYSRNLPKEQIKEFSKSVIIKEAFVEAVVTQEFLGFKVSASYKEKIENYELDFNSNEGSDWMVVTELVVLDEWVLTDKKDIPSILQKKKEDLIIHLDIMQQEGKIQIKKK